MPERRLLVGAFDFFPALAMGPIVESAAWTEHADGRQSDLHQASSAGGAAPRRPCVVR